MKNSFDKKTIRMVEDFKKEIIPIFENNLDQIILFGSYARGEQHEESDIDFLLLAKQSQLELMGDLFDKVNEKTTELMLKHGIFFSFVPENSEYFETNSKTMSLYINILKEGVKIYEHH
jgi:predicted nucleotidyltransferase